MKSFKKLALVATMLSVFATAAHADEHTDLLDLLLQKGIIDQTRTYDRMEKYSETLENKQFNAARIDKDLRDNNNLRFKPKPMMDQSQKTESDSRAKMETIPSSSQVDYIWTIVSSHRTYGTGQTTDAYQNLAEVRRARFGVRGQFAKDFKYQLLANFGNDVGASSTSLPWMRCG
jgi:hypothetical protein